jgi:dihydrodipicolinate synthase/N-acetylneuraminate lyase
MLLEGIYLPVTTPFYPDGRLNPRKLEHNIDRYSRTPVAGLMILGVTAEASGLTDAETAEVLTSAIALAAPHKVMLAGVSRDSVPATLALATIAAQAAYDAIVVAPPTFPLGPDQTLVFFQSIADRSALPVVLSSESGRELAAETITTLASHPNILGLIDHHRTAAELTELIAATKTISREVTVTTIFAAATARMLRPELATSGAFVSAESLGGGTAVLATAPPKPALKTRQKRVGFQILTGSTSGMLDALQAGAVGAVARFGACAPQATYEVFQAWKDSDLPLAAEKQERLRPLAPHLEGPTGIAAIKYGCDLNGYSGGHPRLPLLPLPAAAKLELEALMSTIRN